MIELIVGGSGSGKSAYAEERARALSGVGGLYYLAAMQVWDDEGRARVERHRNMRMGKGFCTIEQPVDMAKALEHMEGEENTALLECMSNLTANEMFFDAIPRSRKKTVEKILRDVERLAAGLSHLVIVTNNVFEDVMDYDETTLEYIRALGAINCALAVRAERVVEVTAGIPLIWKEAI